MPTLIRAFDRALCRRYRVFEFDDGPECILRLETSHAAHPIRLGDGTLVQRGDMGMQAIPYRNPLGRFGEFWENFYSWALMWAYNPGSLRHRRLLTMRRREFWISAEAFGARCGPASVRTPVRHAEERAR